MNMLDQFTEDQRKVIVAEIVKHRDEAYAKGLAEGRMQAGPAAIANWIRTAAGSWTMRGRKCAASSASPPSTTPSSTSPAPARKGGSRTTARLPS